VRCNASPAACFTLDVDIATSALCKRRFALWSVLYVCSKIHISVRLGVWSRVSHCPLQYALHRIVIVGK